LLTTVIVAFVTSFFIVYVITPKTIKLFVERSITSPDVHKPGSPQVPCLGGLLLLAGLMVGFMAGSLVYNIDKYFIAMFMLTILLLGVIGLIDHLIGLSHKARVLLCLLAGFPLALTYTGDTAFHTPIGEVELGLLFYIAIPLVITASSNLTNMLAGYNGLEAGFGALISGTLLLSSLMLRQPETAIMMAAMLGVTLAFLRYNWYPARIFLSDVGTLSLGAVIAVAAIVARIKLPFLICMIPYAVDFFMKATAKFQGRSKYGDTKVNSDGSLDPPPYRSLPHLFLTRWRLSEPKLVKVLLLFETVFCVIALAYTVMQAIKFGLL